VSLETSPPQKTHTTSQIPPVIDRIPLLDASMGSPPSPDGIQPPSRGPSSLDRSCSIYNIFGFLYNFISIISFYLRSGILFKNLRTKIEVFKSGFISKNKVSMTLISDLVFKNMI
jgi:hypothetical protein